MGALGFSHSDGWVGGGGPPFKRGGSKRFTLSRGERVEQKVSDLRFSHFVAPPPPP